MAEELEPPGDSSDAGAGERGAVSSRDRDLLGRRPRGGEAPKSGIRKRLDEIYDSVQKGFEDQSDRSDDIQDYWDGYNCVANGNRYYHGIADIYPPLVHDAVEAIVTRHRSQLFPQGGRYIQCIASDGSTESAIVALLDHYIKRATMATAVVEPLIRNGMIEGQFSLYVDWAECERQIVSRETHGPIDPETGQEMPGEDIEDITEETVVEGFPVFEVLHDPDVLVLPATADSVDEALASGGCVAILRRWSKAKLTRMARDGQILDNEAKDLKAEMSLAEDGGKWKDTEQRILGQLGIRKGGKEVEVWEVWNMLPLDEKGNFDEDKGRDRLCREFFGPQRQKLGCKRNPYWNDRCPLLSRPAKKMSGVFKGPSPISYVMSLQYEANDAVNEGADAATLSAAPMIRRDPEKSNGPIIYGPGAVLDGPEGSLEIFTFPDLTPRAVTRVEMARGAIFQNLSVNPSMLPTSTGAARPNQAQIAQDQAVDLLTTATGVTTLEELLCDAVAWTVDLDYQFRDAAITVRMYGEAGKKAEMQEVSPLVNRHGYTFVWRGGEQVRQNAMIQQAGTGMVNVLMSPPAQQALAAEGKKFTPGKLFEHMVSNTFGPDMAQSVIVDIKDDQTNPPEMEDQWMLDGLMAHVHPLDNDNKHMQAHFQTMQQAGDPHGLIRPHFMAHQQQAQQKLQAQAMQQMMQQQGGMPGGPPRPGGGGPPGGGPGQPEPGANPQGPRLVRGPPGMIHPDQAAAAGGMQMPRRI